MAGRSFKTIVSVITLIVLFLKPGESSGIAHWLKNIVKTEGAEIIEYCNLCPGIAELPLEISQGFSINQKYMFLSNSNTTLPLPSVPVKYIPSTNRWILYMNLRVEDFARIPRSWSILVGNNIAITDSQRFPSSPKPLVPLIPAKNVMLLTFQGKSVTQFYGIDSAGSSYVNLPAPRELKKSSWIPHNRENFHRKPLMWGISRTYLYLIPKFRAGYVLEKDVTKYEQMITTMFRICRGLNATFRMKFYSYQKQDLATVEAHILPIALLAPEYFRFGPPIIAGNYDGVGFLVRKPYPLKSEAHLSIELIIGQPIPLFVSMVMSALVAWVCLVKSGDVPRVSIRSVVGKMWAFVAEICYCQPLPDDPARSHGARFARIPFLLSGLLITSLKQTEYVTHLTATELHYPPRSMEGLNQALGHGYNVSWYGITNSPYYKLLDNTTIQRWKKSFGKDFRLDQADDCLEHLLNQDKHACLGSRKTAQAAMNVFGGAGFTKSTDGLGMVPGAIYVNSRMQHILDPVSHVITRDVEAGLHLNFMSGTFEKIMKQGNSSIKREDDTEEQIRVTDSLLPMSVALAISLVIFIGEKLWVKRIPHQAPEAGNIVRVEVQPRRNTEESINHIWVL